MAKFSRNVKAQKENAQKAASRQEKGTLFKLDKKTNKIVILPSFCDI